jgi:glycosyltransferase involved in cell wall biosynthesis
MRHIFFSMNDFTHEGGGTIRMQGIMNELSKKGQEVIFISNTKKQHLFENNIQHVFIDFPFSRTDKRFFQALLGIIPMFLIRISYAKLFNRLSEIFKEKFDDEPIYFFEYLDNSIGYCLQSQNIIKEYINDLHGVATLEFKFQADHSKSIKDKIKFYAKYYISNLLDKKVFNNAKSILFASQAMQDFFYQKYPKLKLKNNYILPYVLSSDAISFEVDSKLKKELEIKYKIQTKEKIILFAGAFKKTGGVSDLILAFSKIVSFYKTRLIIIGDGPTMNECLSIVKEKNLSDKVIFIGRIPYDHLRTYQDLATIIVCPDKQNVYSELIIHVKYLNALISGKIVVNGSFKSVKEVNFNESLSINFRPSDVESLSASLKYCIDNLDKLKDKYCNNKKYAEDNLTYSSHIKVLINNI